MTASKGPTAPPPDDVRPSAAAVTNPAGPHRARAREDTTQSVPPMSQTGESDLPSTVGPYRVLTPIGEGGMGRVVLAHDPGLDRKIALKLLPPEDADDEGRARFLREARALARIDHKNVVRVFASGTDGETAWMALEYIEGDALNELLEAGPLDELSALELCAQVARGLAAVHAMDIIHRDVKPSNLLLDDDGVVRVLDFGVALLQDVTTGGGFVTQKGIAVGTPHYMAPEQARGETLDARVDAWGLGATLFTILTGRPPFFERDNDSDLEILSRVLREPLPDLGELAAVSETTVRLVEGLLARDTADRPGDLDAIADALEDAADAVSQGTAPMASPRSSSSRLGEDAEGGALGLVGSPSMPSSVEGGATAEVSSARLASVASAPEHAEDHVAAGSSPTRPDGPVAKGRKKSSSRGPLLAAAIGAAAVIGVAAFFAWPASVVTPLPVPEALPDDLGRGGQVRPPPSPAAVVKPREPPILEPAVEPGLDVTPPLPTDVVALSALLARGEEQSAEALDALMARREQEAIAALRLLLQRDDRVGDTVFRAVLRSGRQDRVDLIAHALNTGPLPRQLAAVSALEELRNVAAIEALGQASERHPSPRIRKAALRARRALFSVEGEDAE